jgi:hypothetical protein
MGSAGKGGKGVGRPEVETAVTGTEIDTSILLDPKQFLERRVPPG